MPLALIDCDAKWVLDCDDKAVLACNGCQHCDAFDPDVFYVVFDGIDVNSGVCVYDGSAGFTANFSGVDGVVFRLDRTNPCRWQWIPDGATTMPLNAIAGSSITVGTVGGECCTSPGASIGTINKVVLTIDDLGDGVRVILTLGRGFTGYAFNTVYQGTTPYTYGGGEVADCDGFTLSNCLADCAATNPDPTDPTFLPGSAVITRHDPS